MPVGPTGCEGEVRRGSFFVGAAIGATRTQLRFDGEQHVDITQQAVTAFGGYATASGWSLRGAIGAVLGGSLETKNLPGRHDLRPGIVGAVGVARQWALGDDRWIVTGAATFGASAARTRRPGEPEPRFTATDVRIGGTAGRLIAGVVQPYVLARAFAGPVSWTLDGEDVTGTDTHHYQLGAGLSVTLPSGLSVVADASAIGEQAVSLGISWRHP